MLNKNFATMKMIKLYFTSTEASILIIKINIPCILSNKGFIVLPNGIHKSLVLH